MCVHQTNSVASTMEGLLYEQTGGNHVDMRNIIVRLLQRPALRVSLDPVELLSTITKKNRAQNESLTNGIKQLFESMTVKNKSKTSGGGTRPLQHQRLMIDIIAAIVDLKLSKVRGYRMSLTKQLGITYELANQAIVLREKWQRELNEGTELSQYNRITRVDKLNLRAITEFSHDPFYARVDTNSRRRFTTGFTKEPCKMRRWNGFTGKSDPELLKQFRWA